MLFDNGEVLSKELLYGIVIEFWQVETKKILLALNPTEISHGREKQEKCI